MTEHEPDSDRPAPELPPAIFEALVEMWTQVLCADYLAQPPPELPADKEPTP